MYAYKYYCDATSLLYTKIRKMEKTRKWGAYRFNIVPDDSPEFFFHDPSKILKPTC